MRKCKIHEFRVAADSTPVVAVEIEAGNTGEDFQQEISARAELGLVCRKCGEKILFTGTGSISVYVGC
jgi:hypothetical protein